MFLSVIILQLSRQICDFNYFVRLRVADNAKNLIKSCRVQLLHAGLVCFNPSSTEPGSCYNCLRRLLDSQHVCRVVLRWITKVLPHVPWRAQWAVSSSFFEILKSDVKKSEGAACFAGRRPQT